MSREGQLVVITGLAGAGKTLAANCLEDLGFFCVDNLPVGLVLPFCELLQRGGEQVRRAALVIDAREGAFLRQFPGILQGLRDRQMSVQLLFFECSDQVLKRRFNETRRPHPMAEPGGTLDEALQSERSALARLREMSDRTIDTSNFTSHELRAFLKSAYGDSSNEDVPNVNIVSFGFKYGVPAEVDLLFDVRFLPNPYFVDGLRHLDGRTAEVQAFLDKANETGQFMDHLRSLLEFLIPQYGAEGKTYLVIGIGCTGGKHRSVGLSERLGGFFERQRWPFTVTHRDLGKE